MRLELASPRTAMVSVVILVMHQHSGMVLARGFYRAVGMMVGSVAALLLFFAFPQERMLFLLALAVWISGAWAARRTSATTSCTGSCCRAMPPALPQCRRSPTLTPSSTTS